MAEFRTDPGDRSVAELERQVDEERARLAGTIDALQSKASVDHLVDEVVRVVRDNGGDLGRNLGRAVRDNPLPALLTGVGLAWLMAGSGRPADRWQEDRRSFRDYGSPVPVGDEPSADYVDNGASLPSIYDAGAGGPEAGEEGPGLRERASDALSGLGERAAGAMSGLGERASDVAQAAGARVSGAGHGLRRAGSAARSGVAHAGHGVAHAGSGARHAFDDLLEEQPLVLGALALAIGAAVGGAFPASRTENRMLGAKSDQAKDALREVAGEQGQKLRATAEAVVGEASAIVEETSAELGELLPEGRSLADAGADRLRQAATRLSDAAAEEAERQDLGRIKPVE